MTEIIQTLTTLQELALLCQKIKEAKESQEDPSKLCFKKLKNATQRVLASSALLSDLNDELRQQNGEKKRGNRLDLRWSVTRGS
jgi:hypothetical protein